MDEFYFVEPEYFYTEVPGATGATGATGETGGVGRDGTAFTKCAMYAGFVGEKVVKEKEIIPLVEMIKTPEACIHVEGNEMYFKPGKFLVLATVVVKHDKESPIVISFTKEKEHSVRRLTVSRDLEENDDIIVENGAESMATVTQTFMVEDSEEFELLWENQSEGDLTFQKATLTALHLE